MPNAKDAHRNQESPSRFLMMGGTGSGKTTQFLTLPGKKFLYIFDPNALASIEGYDVDYEEFAADITDVDIAIKTLKGDGPKDTSSRKISPQTYINWEKHFESKWDSGFFDSYSWIGFDSFTLFLELVMDRILFLNQRTGKQPEQADWAAQVNTVGNVFRVFSSRKRTGIYCTAHLDERQDELTKRIFFRPMMTGRLRIRVPLLFNNVLVCHADETPKGPEWYVQTRPDKLYPTVRTSLKGLEFYQDVTIKDFSKPTEYGLGALLKKAGKLPVEAVPTIRTATRR